MPVDPRLLYGMPGQAPPAADPFDSLGKILQFQGYMDDAKLRKTKLEEEQFNLAEKKKGAQDDDDYRAAVQQNMDPQTGEINYQGIRQAALTRGNFKTAERAAADNDKATTQLLERQTKNNAQATQIIATLRPLAQDAIDAYDPAKPESMATAQEKWRLMKQTAIGIYTPNGPAAPGSPAPAQPPKFVMEIPDQFDPQSASTYARLGQTIDDHLKLEKWGLDKAKQVLDNKAQGIKNDKEASASLAALFGTTTDDNSWQQIRKRATESGNYDPAIIDSFGPAFSPDAKAAAFKRGMTAYEQEESAARGRELGVREREAGTGATNAATNAARLDFERNGGVSAANAQRDDPTLPNGVKAYLGTLPTKLRPNGQPYTFEDAMREVQRALPDLQKDHPKLDITKVQAQVSAAFNKPTEQQQFASALGIGNAGVQQAPPGAPPAAGAQTAPPPPAAGASGQAAPPSAAPKDSPDVRDRAKKILQDHNQPSSDLAVDIFLRNPQNRKLMGLK